MALGMRRILVVDDNARNLAIMQRLLESKHVVQTAKSGPEALECVRNFQPDLILLDVMMPGMDGYETCRRIRAQEQVSRPKVIMVSARAMLNERLEGYAAGADDYLTKPFDHEEFCAKVGVYLELKSIQEVDRLRQALLTLIRHETHTPLSILQASMELLVDDKALTAEQRQIALMAGEATRRLSKILDRALLFSRIRSGDLELEPVGIGVSRLLEEVVNGRREALAARKIQVTQKATSEAWIAVDPLFREYVLGALVEHDLEQCEPGTKLSILTEDLGADRVAIRIHRSSSSVDPAQMGQA